MDALLEALQFTFVQHALLAGLLVSLLTGMVGSLIVVNRMVFLAGGIAHASYGGIGLALFFGLPIFLGASIFAVFASLLIAWVVRKSKERLDIFIGLIWAVGMAVGVLFVDLSKGYSADMMGYLFGSILAVSKEDLTYMTALFVLTLVLLLFGYRKILAVSYDSEYAALRGVNVAFYTTLILVLSSLSIVIAIKVVGIILVIAMLTMPVYIAEKLSKSLAGMMVRAGLIATLFTFLGLVASYSYDVSSGAAIVLTMAIGLGVFMGYEKLAK